MFLYLVHDFLTSDHGLVSRLMEDKEHNVVFQLLEFLSLMAEEKELYGT